MQNNKMQRIVLPLAALALALVSEVAWSAPPPESTAFQITVDHAGVTTSGGVLALQQSPAWSAALSSPFSPIIAGGRVFVTAGGSSGSLLYAFDAQTGQPVWGPLNVTATWLTYDKGKLFSVNASGLMQSFDAATGTAGWSVQLPGQYAFSSAPTASNGIVYVGGAGSGGTLYAVNETNGTVLWTGSVANGDDSSPAVGPNGVYVSYACPQVYDFALTSATAAGKLIWNYAGPCEGGGGNTPVYANGELYVRDWTSTPKIFNASTGALTGSFSATAAPAISRTNGFFLNSGTLTGTDLATNTVLWSFASADGSPLSTTPIVVDQTVIIGSSSGTLYGLNTLTGHLTWQVSAGAAITSQGDQSGLAVADGILVVPTASSLLAYKILGPPAPTGLTATAAAGAVDLNWSAAAGATTYNIYMGPSAGSENVAPVQTSVTSTSTTVTNLTPGTAYFFTVKALGSAGISAASNEASATPKQLPAPPAPASLTAVAGSNQVTLSWSASSGATGYNVYMGTSSGGEAATPVMTGVPEVTATISGLTNGTTYFYVVKATNAAGSSPASNEASATPVPPPHPPPPAPANVSAVAASGQVTLSWAASAGATSYSVYMGTSAGGESSTAARAGITGLSTTITGLTNGTTYYYTVKAVDAGGTSAASNETSATPTAPPQPPTPTPTPTGSGGGGGFDVISLLLLATGAALRGSRSARRSLLPVPASK